MQAPFDIPADLDTPVSAFLKLSAFEPRFLLESVTGGEHQARYSFLGFGEAGELRLQDSVLTLDGVREELPGTPSEMLDMLRGALDRAPRLGPDIPGVPFKGGLVGLCGYPFVRRLEGLGAPREDARDLELGLIAPRSLLVFDHSTRLMALLSDGSGAERESLRREVRRALRGPVPAIQQGGSLGPERVSLSRAEFGARFERAQRAIHDGDVYQLVVSNRFEGPCDLDPVTVYRALRLLNPSPYMFLVRLGKDVVIGASPEAMVRLEGRKATLQPIAGTRPRGSGPDQDAAFAVELSADPKEAAEHVMLVDLARNDLGRVAVPGSIQVDPYRDVERFSHVMHLVSGVNGVLEHQRDAFDLFASTFPAGTVVGAPKLRAMQLIDELEPVDRGFYAGTVGYFGHGGSMDQAIAIRTLLLREDEYAYQAGAGIVVDSDPDREYAEIHAKSAALRAALQLAAEGF